MAVDRSSKISRFGFPQTSAEWEQLASRFMAALAKVPLSRWQFLVRLLLVTFLSFSLARLFWLVLPNPVIPPAAVAIPTVSTQVTTEASSVNISQLKSIPLFGKVEPVAAKPVDAPPPIIENQAVNTSLNLVLLGVVNSTNEQEARAIISTGDKSDVYTVGEALPIGNNVTLSKVMSDRVIINNNGQYENLWLYQVDPNAKLISKNAVPAPVQAPIYEPPQGQSNPANDSPERFRAEVSRNLSDVVAMSIYREGGQVLGYKIRPGRDAEKFKSLGLQTDDIITAVNGTPLTNPAKIMEVYKNMGNTTSASLEIKRGGSVMTVDVVLQ